MLPNMNPKQLAQMMKQFGIKSEEVSAEKVVIYRKDGSQFSISEPQVVAMEIQGQKSFQVQGKISEGGSGSSAPESPAFSPSNNDVASFENDVKLVMEQAKVSREEAEQALKETKGDLAAAIMMAKRD